MSNDDVGKRCMKALYHGFWVALAVLIEDMLLYDHLHDPEDDPIRDLLPYTAGVSTILTGYTGLKAKQGALLDAIEAWIIALCGGTSITIHRVIMKRLQTMRRTIATRHEIAGQVAGGSYALDEAYPESGAGD